MSSLIAQYRQLHNCGMFSGASLGKHLGDIAQVIQETKSKTVLDYGCGKARHWVNGDTSVWGVKGTLYDPGVQKFSKKPEGTFDGVICTDVLEHVEDPDAVIADILRYATKFVFLGISCRPSKKKLPDGRPVHICVHPPQWWRDRIKTDLRCELRFDEAG